MNIIKNRIIRVLLFIYILSIIIGIGSYFFIDSSIINNSIINYIRDFSNGFNYINGFKNTFIYNFNYSFIIWIFGLLMIGIIISPLMVFLKGLGLGITISSIIVNFKIKGLILAIIMFISNVLLYDIIFILLSYYSINMSLRTYKVLKKNLSVNIKSYYKNYFIRYIILLVLLILFSLFDIYVISNLIKYLII